jgi:hypothetical protein
MRFATCAGGQLGVTNEGVSGAIVFRMLKKPTEAEMLNRGDALMAGHAVTARFAAQLSFAAASQARDNRCRSRGGSGVSSAIADPGDKHRQAWVSTSN